MREVWYETRLTWEDGNVWRDLPHDAGREFVGTAKNPYEAIDGARRWVCALEDDNFVHVFFDGAYHMKRRTANVWTRSDAPGEMLRLLLGGL